MKWLVENLPLAFPLTSDDSDDACDKTLRHWTAEDFRNADYLGDQRFEMAELIEGAGARNVGDLVGREGLRG